MKVIKDCIYGHIPIPPLCQQFIDQPEFQRLRRVKQLGVAHHVYPSAVHTRFEHSLGVMHLAGKLVNILDPATPPRTVELIQLSGLLHDIGHMALSHLFDKVLLESKITPSYALRHEDRSVEILRSVNRRLALLTNREENFIIDVILGNTTDKPQPWIFEIVCNKQCGIDVDKMDYLRRDAYHTNFPGFQSDYILMHAVIGQDRHICFLEKTQNDIADLFHTRLKMHTTVYQHHACRKFDRIYFCVMKRLAANIFTRDSIDDYELETLLRHDRQTRDLMRQLDLRDLTHMCSECADFPTNIDIPLAGSDADVCYI